MGSGRSEMQRSIPLPAALRVPRRHRAGIRAACLFGLAALTPYADAQFVADAYEAAPAVNAADILPPEELQSGSHRVLDDVQAKDRRFGFELETDFGNYRVESLALLKIRVHEARTLAQAMNAYEANDSTFASHLRGQLTVGADSWVDIIASPLNTASSLAGQLVGNVGETVKDIKAGPAGASIDYSDTNKGGIVVAAHKRNIANQLGLDVYSTNPRVQEFLKLVAKSRSQGRVGAGVTTVSFRKSRERYRDVSGGKIGRQSSGLLLHLTPQQLDEGIDEQLAGMNVPDYVRGPFLHHSAYSPRHKTLITGYLDFMRGVKNRSSFVESALSAKTEADAESFVVLVRTLAAYHEQLEPILRLGQSGKRVTATTASRDLIVFLPADLLFWDAATNEEFARADLESNLAGYRQRELVVAGAVTPNAKRQLKRRGFKIRDSFAFK